MSALTKGCLTAAVLGLMATAGGLAQTQDVAPVNSGANPYRVIRDWAQLTVEKRPWGGSNGVAIDRDGKTVWATDRCSPGTVPGARPCRTQGPREGVCLREFSACQTGPPRRRGSQ